MLCATIYFPRSEYAGAVRLLLTILFLPLGGWGQSAPISIAEASLLSSRSYDSQAAISNDGRAVVVFTHQPGSFSNRNVVFQIINSDGTVSGQFPMSTSAQSGEVDVHTGVAMDPVSGDFAILFERRRTSESFEVSARYFVRFFDADGTAKGLETDVTPFVPPFELDPDRNRVKTSIAYAGDGSGNCYVAMAMSLFVSDPDPGIKQMRIDNSGSFVRVYDSSGALVSTEVIDQRNYFEDESTEFFTEAPQTDIAITGLANGGYTGIIAYDSISVSFEDPLPAILKTLDGLVIDEQVLNASVHVNLGIHASTNGTVAVHYVTSPTGFVEAYATVLSGPVVLVRDTDSGQPGSQTSVVALDNGGMDIYNHLQGFSTDDLIRTTVGESSSDPVTLLSSSTPDEAGDFAGARVVAAPNGTRLIFGAVFPANASLSSVFAIVYDPNSSNTPPSITDPIDNITIPAASVTQIDFTVGDTETAFEDLVISVTSDNPALFPAGSLTVSGSGAIRTLVIGPKIDELGEANITIQVNDGELTTSVTFHFCINTKPVAVPDDARAAPGVTLTIPVTANDRDADNEAITVHSIIQAPAKGTAVIVAGGTAIEYTANPDASGTDSFVYAITDNKCEESSESFDDQAVVNIIINRPPVIVNDALCIEAKDGPTTIRALVNDSDPDGDEISVDLFIPSISFRGSLRRGSLPVSSPNDFIYTPPAGDETTFVDTFFYVIVDKLGAKSQLGKVNISVSNAPIAKADGVRVIRGGTINIPVLVNDNDPDGDDLTVTPGDANALGLFATPLHATFGGFSLIAGNFFTYTPDPNYVGTDFFAYTIDDGCFKDSARVTIVVNTPPIAIDDTSTTLQAQSVSIDVLANDSEPDGQAIRLVSVTQPENGEINLLLEEQEIEYTPDPLFTGTDTFTYFISDTFDTVGATVSITVSSTADPDAPLGVLDKMNTPTNTPTDIHILTNDSDAAGSGAVKLVGPVGSLDPPSAGSIEMIDNDTPADSTDDFIRFTPALDFVGQVNFLYELEDSSGNKSTASAIITVMSDRLSAWTVANFGSINADGTDLNVRLLGNDGLSNLEKFLFAINSEDSEPRKKLPRLIKETDGTVTLRFTRFRDASDVQYEVQTTLNDLSNFQQAVKDVDYTEMITGIGDSMESVDIKFEFPANDNNSLFARVIGKLVTP